MSSVNDDDDDDDGGGSGGDDDDDIFHYANGVARDYSNWLIACVTLERLAMIASPHRAKYFCTPQTVFHRRLL